MNRLIIFFAFNFFHTSYLSAQKLADQASMENMEMSSKSDKTVYPVTGKVRTYYIAADEVIWDYTPGDIDGMTGKPFSGNALFFTQHDSIHIGTKFLKALYREYTDSTFTKLKPRSEDQRYLGLLGPIIRAEVGDIIHVVFRNNATIPYSMHPHGVLYEKPSEGAVYNDSLSKIQNDGSEVAPHHTFTYVWEVPERAGPGPGDPNSVVWLYHSHVNEPKDLMAGLIGAIIISAKGTLKPDLTPKGVDREFVTLFCIFNENNSWYLDRNIDKYCSHIDSVRKNVDTVGFQNLKFSINGFIYSTMPMITMKKGDHVRWYLLSMGDLFNFHTPHWHGNTVIYNGKRCDVISILPAQSLVADMIPDDPGMWMFHCHIDDHMASGMMAMYEVLP